MDGGGGLSSGFISIRSSKLQQAGLLGEVEMKAY